ncbi:ribonuclease ZC3H12 [Biomphalaria glabrata]|nr:ribonuclease ZC3H12 [Biomphalaria glabrata]
MAYEYQCITLQISNSESQQSALKRLDRVINTTRNVFQVNVSLVKTSNGSDINIFSVSENGINVDLADSDSNIIVYKDRLLDFEQNEDRIVYTNAATHDVDSSFSILIKADCPPENIKTAKNFLRSHLEQDTSYSSDTFHLNTCEEFEMVYIASSDIQKSTLVFMDFFRDEESFMVSLQGPEKSLCSARTKIVMLLDNYREQVYKENYTNSNICQSSLTKDGYLFNHFPSLDTQSSATDMSSPIQHFESVDENLIPNLSLLNVDVSDDEVASALEDITNNPLYSRHFEQALKLGYTENQISKALHKLGPNCGWNDLLGEVITIAADDATKLSDKETESSESKNLSPDANIDDINQGGNQADMAEFMSGLMESRNDNESNNLRHIIIDGSNVAMSHGKQVFSCKGIKLAVDWFRERGHKDITAFVPQWRKETSRPDAPITDQDILLELEREKILVFTPSRRVKGRRVVCYDDRYILNLAKETEGIIVSNDMYRDLVNESEEFRRLVDQRLLMYSFVNDRFMPPEDPLGRFGPSLENFLRKTPIARSKDSCPYGKKCTYGNRCRFFHPERGSAPLKSISDTLKEQAEIKLQERTLKQNEKLEKVRQPKQKLSRTKSLFPTESLEVEDFSGKQEKPKLVHSKSLVLPVKTADYLNEPRKMLEKAEQTAARETASDRTGRLMASSAQFQEDIIKPDNLIVKSSRTSPVLQRENIQQPLNFSPSRSVRSPSHLTVPKSEQPERYLSGHLLLAKKLSNEGNESNFFSDHISSPSSTRTSSPVLAVLKPEQKHMLDRTFSLTHQLHRPDENIPNLSIFESLSPHKYQNVSGHWEDKSQSGPLYGQYFCDSGQYSASDSMSNPIQPPAAFGGKMYQAHEHLGLRRSFSSSQHPNRRASAADDHLLLKQQQSMPLDPFPSTPLGICRQNSTSDPQIHNNLADGYFFNGRQQPDSQPPLPTYPPPLVQSFNNAHQYSLQHMQQPYQTFDNQQTRKASLSYMQEPYFAPVSPMIGYMHNMPAQYSPRHNSQHARAPHNYHHQNVNFHHNYSPSGFMPALHPLSNNLNTSPHHAANTMAMTSPHHTTNTMAMTSPHHAANTMAILPEDEPILPDDPRYAIYYHLSSVFGEPVVRKVMNRNPHVLEPEDVCSLIFKYKQERLS